jgi:hypothetical protein
MSYDYQPGYAPRQTQTSTMAIISLIASILGFTLLPFLGSIAAVITGSMAKKEIQQSGGALTGEGMASAGLILGWIGIGLGVLGLCIFGAVMLLPLCLVPLGLSMEEFSSLLPFWLSIF